MKILVMILLLSVVVCAQSTGVPASVSVVGEAEMKVVPNQVIFTLEVITSGKEVAVAKRANDKAVAQLLAVAKAFGVSEEDVRTDSLTVGPRYSTVRRTGTTREEQVLSGYEVKNRTLATLKDLNRIDDFLTKAIEAGVNRVVSIDIAHSEIQKFEEQTRALAVKNAEAKARSYAQQLGLTLGKAYVIREEDADQPGYAVGYGSGSGAGDGSGVPRLDSPPMAFDREVAFALGRIELAEKIFVMFELKR